MQMLLPIAIQLLFAGAFVFSAWGYTFTRTKTEYGREIEKF
jgi:hypothetical protein